MNQPITMPALSDTMTNGRLVRWVKRVGEPIKRGERIADIETDKAIMEVEAFQDGYLAGPLAAENAELPVGSVLGYISDALSQGAETSSAPAVGASSLLGARALALTSAREAAAPAGSADAPASRATVGRRLSPYARARERAAAAAHATNPGITPPGDGPGQGTRAPRADPQASAPAAPSGLPAGGGKAGWPSAVRAAVARNVIRSMSIPMFRVTALLEVGTLRHAAHAAGRSLTLLLARAGALCARSQPLFNACCTPDGLQFRVQVDVGIAIDTPDGLIAAVLRDVAGRPLEVLSVDWRDLRAKALTRRLRLGDYEGATFYLSNLGTFDVVQSADAVLPVGAAAILCVGAIHDGHANCTLVCDHRVVSGADAARFLSALGERLSDPAALLGGHG